MSVEAYSIEGEPGEDNLGSRASLGACDLDQIYRRYAHAIRSFCAGRLGGNPADAEDACQETLLKVYGALPRFRDGPMWPWLRRIATNVCIDMQRKRMRENGVGARGEATAACLLPAAAGSGLGSEDPEAQSIRTALISAAVDRLPDRPRSLIYDRYYKKWSYERIAQSHGMAVPAVATALTRARRSLRRTVERIARKEGLWPLPALAAYFGLEQIEILIRWSVD